MAALLSLDDLLRTALGYRAVGFTLRSGLHPVIYWEKRVQTCGIQISTSEDIEKVLRHLVTTRQMREYRATGLVHFKCVFDNVSLIGGARQNGEEIRVEVRRMAA